MVTAPFDSSGIDVLAFDVFGTVVDWHGTISRHVDALALRGADGGRIDGSAFALAWRAGYKPAMARVRSGELPWTRIDDLHRMILDDVLARYGIPAEDAFRRALNLVWHRLDGWPDSAQGLARLKSRFTITTLSNGNIALLTAMAKHAKLPWDCVLSAEVFRHYKPDPETYLGVADVFAVAPTRVLMVAAHADDLDAARACGLRTAYVERPFEYGRATPAASATDAPRDPAFDLHATDLNDLAAQLGC
ncbi:MAG: haloacid dehalogenase type II [Lautropia sp.]